MGNEKVILTDIVWFQEGPGVRNTQYTDSGVKLLMLQTLSMEKLICHTRSRVFRRKRHMESTSIFL